MSEGTVRILISMVAANILMYLVWLTGIILACKTWKRNPKASLFTLLAIVFLFVFNLTSIFLSALPIALRDSDYSMVRIATLTGIAHVVLSILSAGSWGLLLAAIFIERKPSFQQKT